MSREPDNPGHSPLHWRVREQLYQGIAHDLRGTLMAIQLSAEELGVECTSGTGDLVQEIHDAVARAKGLVNDLTRLVQSEPRPEPLTVNTFIEQRQRQFRRMLGAGSRLDLELAARPTEAHVDRTLLVQVLFGAFNLVSATLETGQTLTVRTHRFDPGSMQHSTVGERPRIMIGVCASGTSDSWLCCEVVSRPPADQPGAADIGILLGLADRAEIGVLADRLATPSQIWLAVPCAD